MRGSWQGAHTSDPFHKPSLLAWLSCLCCAQVTSVAFDKSGSYLAVGGTDVRVYTAKKTTLLATLSDHTATVNSVRPPLTTPAALLAVVEAAACASLQPAAAALTTTARRSLAVGLPLVHLVTQVQWGPNAKFLATASANNTIKYFG